MSGCHKSGVHCTVRVHTVQYKSTFFPDLIMSRCHNSGVMRIWSVEGRPFHTSIGNRLIHKLISNLNGLLPINSRQMALTSPHHGLEILVFNGFISLLLSYTSWQIFMKTARFWVHNRFIVLLFYV